jgi:vitamin B12 transporter
MKQGKGEVRKIVALTLMALGGPQALWAQDANILDTTVVTANRLQERAREVSSNVTVINEADIKASTASTVADVLVQQGFYVVTTGDSSSVQIRGYGSWSMANEYENTVLILLNGRRTGSSNLALANLANVERIEIIRGPSAVQYGSNAMGGVINIITKKGMEKPVASLELGLGSDGLKREKLALSGAKNDFDYALGVTNYKRNDMTMNDGDRWRHTSVRHNSMVDLDLGYTFNENHRVGVNYYYGEIKSNLPGDSFRVANSPDAAYSQYTRRVKNATFSYTGKTQDKRFDWSTSYTSGGYEQRVPEQTSFWGSTPAYTNDLDTKSFNAQGGYNGEIVSASIGMDYYKYDIKPNDTEFAKYSMKDLGLYATGKLRFLDERLIFSAGLRRDRYTNDGRTMSREKDNETTGSIGVAYLPVNWLKLRTNYAKGFKMPSPTQVGGSEPYYEANSDLSPERSKTWEFGADVTWNYINGSLTYFHSDWKNKIVGMSTVGLSHPYQFQNVKDATLAGIEGSLSVDVGKAFQQNYSLKPYVSFTYLDTRKNKDESQRITVDGKKTSTLRDTPEWMASYGIDYAHPGYKIKSRINANYYDRKYTSDTANYTGFFKQNSGTVVNLSLEKELVDFSSRFGALTLRAEINNLFDGANEMYFSYPDAGRSFYVGLRYDFK